MDKCREAFEKKFPIPAHWIEFDEKQNKYYCPYVADAKAFEYQEMWGVWQSRQAEVDELQEEYAETELYLRGQLTDRDSKIANLEYLLEQDKSLIPILNKKLKEKDKRIAELEKLNEVGRYARQRFINKFIGIQNHIDVNAFKAMESDPECFVICAEDLTEFIKEALRGEHEA